MAIRKMEAVPFAIREPTERELAYGKIAVRRNVLVFIEDDSGKRGMSEVTPIPFRWGCEETVESVVAAVNSYIAPLLIGEDPTRINALLDRIASRVGEIPYTRSGVCEALYDLCGNLAGVPVHRLLGGMQHATLDASWSIAFKSEKEMAAEAAWAVKQGFKWVKIKIGSRNPAQDIRNVAAVREAVGPDQWIHVDANAGYSYLDAVHVLPEIDRFRPRLIEQPVAGWDLDGMCKLRRKLRSPLMADESVRSYRDMQEVIRRGAADAVLMKLNKHGGIREAQKIADLAQSANIAIYPGIHFATSIGVAAHAQFYCTLAHPTPGDFHQGTLLYEHDLVTSPIKAVNGEVTVPTTPGMGVTLDAAMFAKARVDRPQKGAMA
jgi:L-alanine-DL-glutamate epimerase-like enolase superfamily enzyme